MAPSPLSAKTILLVNTGSQKKRFILQKLNKIGCRVVAINTEKNWAQPYVDDWIIADTYNHSESIEAIRNWLSSEANARLDGAVTYWEDDIPLLAKICGEFKLRGNTLETSLLTRDKFRMQERLAQCGLPHIPQKSLKSRSDLEEAIGRIGFPAVMKPVFGSDSQFVIRVENEHEARSTYELLLQKCTPQFDPIFKYNRKQFLYQRFVEGPEFSLECYCQHGVPHVVGLLEKTPMNQPFFLETGDFCPPRIPEDEQQELIDAAKEALIVLGVRNSIAHVEMKYAEHGPVTIEIASRMGGDYTYEAIRRVYGFDLIEASVLIATGQNVPWNQPEPKCHIVGHFVIPEQSGVITKLRGAETIRKHASCFHFFGKNVGDSVLVPPQGFENVGWLCAEGKTSAAADKTIREAVRSLHWDVTPFRTYSSVGRTQRKSRVAPALLSPSMAKGIAKIEKIRSLPRKDLRKLHVGIACNIYSPEEMNPVEADLMNIGRTIERTLSERGYRVSFFDFNDITGAIEKLAGSDVDIIFNVCERINNSSLLEPHVASILDILKIPYTGSNPFTLGLCIDKIRVKKLLQFHDIPTPKWDYAYSLDDTIRDDLHYPLIVKPANTDNSIGITNDSVVTDKLMLQKQLERVIVELNSPALVEEYIEGDEFDISIIGNDEEDLRVLPLSRSVFDALPKGYWHIFPYDAKWGLDPAYRKIISEKPAKISRSLTSLISEIALDTYNILDCHDYGRVEVRTDKEGNPYVLELNPNPSIEDGDCVPKCAQLVGMDYGDFLEEILRMAIKRYKDRPPYYHLQTSLL